MAGAGQQRPWTNQEKNELLAEYIKQANPPHNLLYSVVNNLQHRPPLEDVALPQGRSLNACRAVLEEMRRGPVYPLAQTGVISTPTAGSMPHPRTTGLEGRYTNIAPKASGYAYPTTTVEQPLKRKRGRPTKAQQQQRAAEQAAFGETSGQAARFQTPLSASVPPSPQIDTRPSSTPLPPVSRMPISAIVSTPTAAPKSASHSSSSSGKRRRHRRMDDQGQEEAGSPRYASPYSRLEDTPVGTAARRRDEPIHSSVARLGVSEPEQSAGAQTGPSTRASQYQGGTT